MTAEERVDGSKYPVWLPRPIAEEERAGTVLALADIELRLKPATPREITEYLADLAEYYGVKKSQEALDTTFGMMVEDLAEFSYLHIVAAVREHRRENDFFPRSSELRPLLIRRKTLAMQYRRRARILLGLEEPKKWERQALDTQLAKEAMAAPPKLDVEAKLAGLDPDLARGLRRLLLGASKPEKDPERIHRDTEAA